jgi:hypothetical protein
MAIDRKSAGGVWPSAIEVLAARAPGPCRRQADSRRTRGPCRALGLSRYQGATLSNGRVWAAVGLVGPAGARCQFPTSP